MDPNRRPIFKLKKIRPLLLLLLLVSLPISVSFSPKGRSLLSSPIQWRPKTARRPKTRNLDRNRRPRLRTSRLGRACSVPGSARPPPWPAGTRRRSSSPPSSWRTRPREFRSRRKDRCLGRVSSCPPIRGRGCAVLCICYFFSFFFLSVCLVDLI